MILYRFRIRNLYHLVLLVCVWLLKKLKNFRNFVRISTFRHHRCHVIFALVSKQKNGRLTVYSLTIVVASTKLVSKMLPVISPLPIRLGIEALRYPARQYGYTPLLNISRRVKPLAFTMVVSRRLLRTGSKYSRMRMSSKAKSPTNTINHSPFVSKGPPIPLSNDFVCIAMGLIAGLALKAYYDDKPLNEYFQHEFVPRR